MPHLPMMLRWLLCSLSVFLLASLWSTTSTPAIAQSPEPCRSTHDARQAFGRCAGDSFDFYAFGPYRDNVPRPDAVLGHALGTWHTTYGTMETYIDTLASAASDRVRHIPYGTSIEGQTQHLLAIGGSVHIEALDNIRADMQRLTDPRATSEADAEQIAAERPAIVWINAANDGNETAAFEAVIQMAYQLAAGEDERTQRIRDDVVVLINMAHNPESLTRHIAWYNAFGMGDADPQALEHNAPWGLSTNNNHYQIDLNRDGLSLTQKESRNVTTAMQHWRPQVFVDLHGQTTQYFFPPNAIPVNPTYPDQLADWIDRIGRGNADTFDEYGWSYYTRDVFDLFYPGYWDSYPSFHGATGMTYETDGGGSKGSRWRRDDGTILTFEDGIAHHFVASLATMETAANGHEERLMDYYRYFADALDEGTSGAYAAAVLLPGSDARAAARLATTLRRHGITVEQVDDSGTVQGYDVVDDATGSVEVPAGAFVVPFDQPNFRLAEVLLAPNVDLPEGFRQQELTRLARNLYRAPGEREGYAFYDITAWNLALAAGVPIVWTDTAPNLSTTSVTLSEDERTAAGGWHGDVAEALTPDVSTQRAQSAYVWPSGSRGATRLLARLMGEGFNVAVVERPLVVEDTPFPRGSYIARVERNPDDLHDRIAALAEEAGVDVRATDTAFQAYGPTGTGSEATRSLRAPHIGVLAGDGVSITSYGALWFTLEQQLGQPFTALRTRTLTSAALDAFDVLILPNGSYSTLTDAARERMANWARQGGTLIGYAGGARHLTDHNVGTSFSTDEEEESVSTDTLQTLRATIEAKVEGAVGGPPAPSPSADIPELTVPGAFLRAEADTTHWLTYGYHDGLSPVLTQNAPLAPSHDGATPVTYATDRLRVSGFVWPELGQRTYAGQAYATVDRAGEGMVIRLAEDPLFRTFADGPLHLLTNAIYLGARGDRTSSGY